MSNQTTDTLSEQVAALIRGGIATNTARAHQRDSAYYERWYALRLGTLDPFPSTVPSILQFIVDHTTNMPECSENKLLEEGYRRKKGPLALATLRRYLATIASIHTGNGWPDPTKDGQVKMLLRRIARQPSSSRTKKRAITTEVMKSLIATCQDNNLIDLRDKAILLTGFSSGGRRRSELATMEFENLTRIDEGYLMTLLRSKTDQVGNGKTVPILGEAAQALSAWLTKSRIQNGRLFRGVDRWGNLSEQLSDRSIHRIIVERLQLAGFDKQDYCAHSLRYGFLSEAGKQGISLGDAMAMSGHSTIATALRYYRAGETQRNPAAKLFQTE